MVTLNRAVKLDSTTSGHKVGINFSVADGVSNHRSVLYLDDATGDTVIDRASTSGAMQFKIRQNGIDQFALSTTGAATFSDDINIAAGKKLAYSATTYMTPENNSTGAEIRTPGSLIVKTGVGATTALVLTEVAATFSGTINIPTSTPASAGAAGTTGDIAWDSSYVYVCTATNTWKRTAIATW